MTVIGISLVVALLPLSSGLSNTEEATGALSQQVPHLRVRKSEASSLSEDDDADLTAEFDSLGDVTIGKGSEKLTFHVAPKQPITLTDTEGTVHVQLGSANVYIPETSRADRPRDSGVEASKIRRQNDFKGTNYRIPPKLLLADTRYPNIDSTPPDIQKNIKHTIALNPGYKVTWFDGAACLDYMEKHAIDPKLVQQFQEAWKSSQADTGLLAQGQGEMAADICRAAWLFHNGGFFVDCDLEPAVPFADMVDKDTGFMSGWASGSFKKDGTCSTFNPKDGTCEFELLNGFAGVEPNSPILKRQLELMAGAAAGKFWYPGIDESSSYLGPYTLSGGLKDVLANCHVEATVVVRKSDWTVCDTKVRMFEEEDIRDPSARTPSSVIQSAVAKRESTSFKGLDFALFYPGDPPALVGFSRFDACKWWHCRS